MSTTERGPKKKSLLFPTLSSLGGGEGEKQGALVFTGSNAPARSNIA